MLGSRKKNGRPLNFAFEMLCRFNGLDHRKSIIYKLSLGNIALFFPTTNFSEFLPQLSCFLWRHIYAPAQSISPASARAQRESFSFLLWRLVCFTYNLVFVKTLNDISIVALAKMHFLWFIPMCGRKSTKAILRRRPFFLYGSIFFCFSS